MDEHGTKEGSLTDWVVPQQHEYASADLESVQRDQAQRVIEQMRDDIEEEDVARPQTEPPDHDITSRAPIVESSNMSLPHKFRINVRDVPITKSRQLSKCYDLN